MKELLSGNEALARGALEAGIEIACGYPGTPSSEILENVAKYKEIYSEWSVNEKVAMDAAAGAAYSGRRSMVTTKQVGMNVLSDSLFYTAYTGAEAALVVISADDPGLFSSQNEQDNRHYAKLGKFPMLEPCDSQECKDFMGEAVAISERFDTPVVIRTTMRTSHSKSVVELGEPASYGKQVGPFPRNMEKYNCMCTWARERHYVLEQRLLDLEAFSNEWPGNAIHWGDREYGFIAGGILYEYVRQVFPGASILKIGMCYPLPKKLIREFAEGVKNVIVVEELDPFMEEQIRAMGIDARGKSIFPICGELLPEDIGDGRHQLVGLRRVVTRLRGERIAGIEIRDTVHADTERKARERAGRTLENIERHTDVGKSEAGLVIAHPRRRALRLAMGDRQQRCERELVAAVHAQPGRVDRHRRKVGAQRSESPAHPHHARRTERMRSGKRGEIGRHHQVIVVRQSPEFEVLGLQRRCGHTGRKQYYDLTFHTLSLFYR